MADEPTTNEPGPGPGQDPVPTQWILLLSFYLVALAGVLLWGIYSRWPSCVFVCTPQTAAAASPSPTPTATATATATATPTPTPPPTATPTPTPTPPPTQTQSPTSIPPPTIESVSPKTALISCKIQVTIKGKNFKKDASVTFGGVPATVLNVDPSGLSINVEPPAHAEGDVDVVVKNVDGTTSDISKDAFKYTCPPLPDTDLLLLVIFAGALGGTLHGLRSLYWYVGLRSLLKSWTLMYVLLPFTGATISVIFYSIMRAGLVPTPTSKDASIAVIAIAILVGLFSQQAAVKLKDIFEGILAKPAIGPAAESKPQGSVPPGGSPESKPGQGGPKPAFDKAVGKPGDKVQIKGTGMKSVKSVTFGTIQLAPEDFTLKDGTLTVTVPTRPATQTDPKVNVIVVGEPGTFTLEFTYQ